MANTSFDFNKIKKRNFSVTLKNGDKLQVRMPTKRIYEEMKLLNTSKDSKLADQAADLYEVTAHIISNNLNDKVYTTDMVEEMFDYEDLSLFIVAYAEYVQEANNSPN